MLLFVFSAPAQNLFVGSGGDIYEFAPGGTQSIFASGLNYPDGIAFNSAGNLFVANEGSDTIYKYTPGGTQITFASGLNEPLGLAFNRAKCRKAITFTGQPRKMFSLFCAGSTGTRRT